MNRKSGYKDMERYRETKQNYYRRYYKTTENARNKRKRWSGDEDKLIIEHSITDRELSEIIGRSMKAILVRRTRLKKAEKRGIRMNYFKARYLKDGKPSGNAYTFKSQDDVKAGDTVVNAKGSRLIVVGEADESWLDTYGREKVAEVRKIEEPVKEYRIVDIRDNKTGEIRTDGRYPLRIGRIVKEPKPKLGAPMILEYLRNADGSDYSRMILRTSRVIGLALTDKDNLIVETMNSSYEFEPVKAESEEN